MNGVAVVTFPDPFAAFLAAFSSPNLSCPGVDVAVGCLCHQHRLARRNAPEAFALPPRVRIFVFLVLNRHPKIIPAARVFEIDRRAAATTAAATIGGVAGACKHGEGLEPS